MNACRGMADFGQFRTVLVAVQFARNRSLALMERRGAGGAISICRNDKPDFMAAPPQAGAGMGAKMMKLR